MTVDADFYNQMFQNVDEMARRHVEGRSFPQDYSSEERIAIIKRLIERRPSMRSEFLKYSTGRP